jgi:hypothetical protein
MREWLFIASWNLESASMCIALFAWICGTVWLLSSASRTERGLWELRKRKPVPVLKNQRSRATSPKRFA